MLKRQQVGAVVLFSMVLIVPTGGIWAQKAKNPMPPASNKADSSKLAPGKYSGVVKSVPNKDRVFDVEMPLPGGKKLMVEFQLSEKAKVRTMLLPEAFDDKGNPKKYTRKELDELKGTDRSAPGYESAVEQMSVGQTVQMTVVSVPRAPGASGKKKGEAADGLQEFVDKSRQIRLLVIVNSPEGGEGGGPAVKKKK